MLCRLPGIQHKREYSITRQQFPALRFKIDTMVDVVPIGLAPRSFTFDLPAGKTCKLTAMLFDAAIEQAELGDTAAVDRELEDVESTLSSTLWFAACGSAAHAPAQMYIVKAHAEHEDLIACQLMKLVRYLFRWAKGHDFVTRTGDRCGFTPASAA